MLTTPWPGHGATARAASSTRRLATGRTYGPMSASADTCSAAYSGPWADEPTLDLPGLAVLAHSGEHSHATPPHRSAGSAKSYRDGDPSAGGNPSLTPDHREGCFIAESGASPLSDIHRER